MRRHLDKTVSLAGFAPSVLVRDFVGLLRELSMGVTEAQTLELPDRRRSRPRLAAGTAGMKLVERPAPQAAINDVVVQVHASGFAPTELTWPSTWTDRR